MGPISFEDFDAFRNMGEGASFIDPEKRERIVQGFIDHTRDTLAKNPLLLRYIKHRTDTLNAHDSMPWMALGQRLYAMATIANYSDLGLMSIGGDYKSRPMTSLEASGLIVALSVAQVYLWADKVNDEWREMSQDFPKCVVDRDILQYPSMFLCYETGYTTKFSGHESTVTDWMLLLDHKNALSAHVYGSSIQPHDDGSTRPWVASGGVPYQREWENAGSAVVLSRLAFINSPYVDIKREKILRQMRRSLEREAEGKCDDLKLNEDVGVVCLRAQKTEAGQQNNHASVNWQHHWWVRGHYRMQWYAASKSHKVIWVAPHVKGPTDKPLKEKVYAVVR